MPVMALGRLADCPKDQVKVEANGAGTGETCKQTDVVQYTMHSDSYRMRAE